MLEFRNGFYKLMINHRGAIKACTFYSDKVIVRLTNNPLVGTCNQTEVWTIKYFKSVLIADFS